MYLCMCVCESVCVLFSILCPGNRATVVCVCVCVCCSEPCFLSTVKPVCVYVCVCVCVCRFQPCGLATVQQVCVCVYVCKFEFSALCPGDCATGLCVCAYVCVRHSQTCVLTTMQPFLCVCVCVCLCVLFSALCSGDCATSLSACVCAVFSPVPWRL